MENKAFNLMVIRALKGAPISCFTLLKYADRPLDEKRLIDGTGYSKKKVHSAMLLLQEYGLAKLDNDNKWQLAEKANFLDETN